MAIIRTIIVKNDTVKLDFWDNRDDFLRHKVAGGQGIEVSLASLERCPAVLIDSTVGKQHLVNSENSGVPVPHDCGTIVVDSSCGPVDVVLADPALRKGIKRVTVVAVKLVHPIDVLGPCGPVFDTENVVFHTEGSSYTFAAVQTEQATMEAPQASEPEPVFSEGAAVNYWPPSLPVLMPGTWAWYPIARYLPNFIYY